MKSDVAWAITKARIKLKEYCRNSSKLGGGGYTVTNSSVKIISRVEAFKRLATKYNTARRAKYCSMPPSALGDFTALHEPSD
ncbi:MAG: hypothetical protein QW734_08575 [Candidatus Bathyarchaeia archaeon]